MYKNLYQAAPLENMPKNIKYGDRLIASQIKSTDKKTNGSTLIKAYTTVGFKIVSFMT
jgi:hypothetical protein